MDVLNDAAKRRLDRIDEMTREMEASRAVSRDTIFRVVVLAGAIVGFSATALSLQAIDVDARASLLRVSWLLFAAAVLLGPLLIYVEARAQYAITWRAIQAQEFDQARPSLLERAKIIGVVIYTIFVRPRNLIFVRHTDYGDKRKAWINGVIIQRLHVVLEAAIALELLFWALFAAALAMLAVAVA